jgi:hypothetical protein
MDEHDEMEADLGIMINEQKSENKSTCEIYLHT